MYGHWDSLTSSAKYIGMGYSTSIPHYGTAATAAGHPDDADGDVTGTTDYFRGLVDKAKASKAATVDPSLKTALDNAQAAYDSAKSELDASNATLATAKTNLSTAPSAYDKAAPDSKEKATALSTAQSDYDAAVKDAGLQGSGSDWSPIRLRRGGLRRPVHGCLPCKGSVRLRLRKV